MLPLIRWRLLLIEPGLFGRLQLQIVPRLYLAVPLLLLRWRIRGKARRLQASVMIGAGEQIMRVVNNITIGFTRDLTPLLAHGPMILALVEVGMADVPVLALPILSIILYLVEVMHSLTLREAWKRP